VSLVLINGEFYRNGELVKGAEVIQILNDRVVLMQDDEEKILWLIEDNGEEQNL